MEGGRRQHLLDTTAALSSALAAKKKEINAAQKRLRSQWRFSKPLQRAALILFGKGHNGSAVAAAFLSKEAKQRHWPEKADAELRRMVEEWFLEIDIDDFNSLCDADNPSDLVAMRHAMKFWHEWSVAAYIEDANFNKGVAPSTAAVLDRCEQLRAELPESAQPAAKGAVAQGKARAWAFRHRKRWGFSHGAIPTKDDLPAQERWEKACRGESEHRCVWTVGLGLPQMDDILTGVCKLQACLGRGVLFE